MTRAVRTLTLLALAIASMAHVGSPDTFFTGQAGPYPVRVSVRLPGVIPGLAQIPIRIAGESTQSIRTITVQAVQWNVGPEGAPPPDPALPVPGDPELFDAVNAAVRRFKTSGAWAASYARHLGQPVPEPPTGPERTLAEVSGGVMAQAARERVARADQPLPSAPKGTVLRRIQDRGHLVVAVKQDVPGFGFRDPASGDTASLTFDVPEAQAPDVLVRLWRTQAGG